MNNVALITGASSGIGRALATEFAGDGFDLVLVAEPSSELPGRSELAKAARELRTDFPSLQIVSIEKDLTRESAPEEIYRELQERDIEVHTLVNDAGIGQNGSFTEIPLEREISIIRLNVEALVRMTKLFLPQMSERNQGAILNLGSVAGFQPGPLFAVYHASKAFVISFSESLAEELTDTGITVTCLCPGPTETDFFWKADLDDTRIKKYGYIMDPAEVARLGYQALKSGERVYIPGAPNKVMTFMRRVIPVSLQAKLAKQFYEKVEESL